MEFLSAYKLSFEYQPDWEAVVPDALSCLHTVVLEPGWLPWVSRSQHSDPELAPLIVHAQSNDGHFCLCGGGEHPTLYWVLNDSEVLVLLAKGGFHEIVLCELHDSALGGHLGAWENAIGSDSSESGGPAWEPTWMQYTWQGAPLVRGSRTGTQRPPGPL